MWVIPVLYLLTACAGVLARPKNSVADASDAVSNIRLLVPLAITEEDQPFSKIPVSEFVLDEQFSQKKDLMDLKLRPPRQSLKKLSIPVEILDLCLQYFRGDVRPQRAPVEVMLNICNELLDTVGIHEISQPRINKAVDKPEIYNIDDVNSNEDTSDRVPSDKITGSVSAKPGKDINFWLEKSYESDKDDRSKVDRIPVDSSFWIKSLNDHIMGKNGREKVTFKSKAAPQISKVTPEASDRPLMIMFLGAGGGKDPQGLPPGYGLPNSQRLLFNLDMSDQIFFPQKTIARLRVPHMRSS